MESYSIMMVDDERFVVDWLSELLETRLEGEHTLYRVYSSRRALQIIERTRIDLLITDINMPGTNGLELIEAVNRFWPLCKCILLTGHAEFEYAKSAISKPYWFAICGQTLRVRGAPGAKSAFARWSSTTACPGTRQVIAHVGRSATMAALPDGGTRPSHNMRNIRACS